MVFFLVFSTCNHVVAQAAVVMIPAMITAGDVKLLFTL